MGLGLQISIERTHNSNDAAEYVFAVREGNGGVVVRQPTGRPGRLRIDKQCGDVALLARCPDEPGPEDALFVRAAVAVGKHWARGEYPERTAWAA